MAQFVTRTNTGIETFRFDQSINRLVGSVAIGAGNASGSVTIPDNISGTPFFYCEFSQTQESQDNGRLIQLNGRTISWNNILAGTVIRYGVF